MTHQQLAKFWLDWNKSEKILRFGQFVINNSDLPVPNPALFHETDPNKAYEICQGLCVDFNQDESSAH